MLEELKAEVLRAHQEFVKKGLVTLTWGNCSAIDRQRGYIVIKPSGVDYDKLVLRDLVVVDLNGKVVEGNLVPSSDTATHLYIYKHFPNIGSIIHTHSVYATSWAQSGLDLPLYGTTHADAFNGPVPNTRNLTPEEVKENYELNTGKLIVETFEERNLDYEAIPGVLVRNHGPFVWGPNVNAALENAITLETISKMALMTRLINPDAPSAPSDLLEKHYKRKHGKDAYYGQKKK